jgi:hypothetical protein
MFNDVLLFSSDFSVSVVAITMLQCNDSAISVHVIEHKYTIKPLNITAENLKRILLS